MEWISVKDALPEKGYNGTLLGYNYDGWTKPFICHFFLPHHFVVHVLDNRSLQVHVTHWLIIPEEPWRSK